MKLPHVVRAISSANVVLVAYPEGLKKVRQSFSKEAVLLPETGCPNISPGAQNRKNLIWVGKNVPRKQFALAAQAFSKSKLSRSENLIVVGEFSKSERQKWRNFPNIQFKGQLRRDDVLAEMSLARALLFTSVHEGNPHVVYEALSTQTPVLCHNSYGMGQVINENVGMKIEVENFKYSLKGFSEAIDLLTQKNFPAEGFHDVCQSNSWNARILQLIDIYESVLNK